MEYEHDEDKESQSLVQRLRESPRTVSALIIILIVVAAIYAFSGDNNTPSEELALSTATPTAEESEEGEESPDAEGDINGDGTTSTTASPTAEATPAPQAERTSEGYKEFAQAGDGVTHVARRAVDKYLSENTTDFEVSAEHKVYMEDYIKDQIGSQPLELNEEVTVTFSMIEEARDAAKNLTDSQLQNLQQYTHAG